MMNFFGSHPIAVRLPLTVDVTPVSREVAALPEEWWQRHLGPYHNGGWEALSLWAPGGDQYNQKSTGGAFAATAALARSPHLQEVIDRLPGTKNRVRLMRLRPGGVIMRHSDPMADIDPALVRLHIPIDTNPDVDFRVAGKRLIMQPGEVWHVDVRFPHQVRNDGSTMRVHLVADLIRSKELDQWSARGTSMGEGRLTGYFAKYLLPRRVRLTLGIGN